MRSVLNNKLLLSIVAILLLANIAMLIFLSLAKNPTQKSLAMRNQDLQSAFYCKKK